MRALPIPEATLRELYVEKKLSGPQIASILKVPADRVRAYIWKYKLPMRQRVGVNPHPISKDILRELHSDKKLSACQIATHLNRTNATVYYYLRKFSITRREITNDKHRKLPNDETLKHLYLDEHLSSNQIAERYGLTSNSSCCRLLRMLGIIRPEKGLGSRHSKPDPIKHIKGYSLTYAPNHPRANIHGYVWNHILAIEKHTGVVVPADMRVHHIDFDKTNNDPNNLLICTQKDHSDYHWRILYLAQELMKKEIIKFSREKGYYLSM